MQIDWWTLALQAINFVVLVWLLRRFLYHPVKEVIAKRWALSEEVLSKAATKEQEAEALKQRLEEERAALAQERREMLKAVEEQSAKTRAAATEKSRADAQQMIEDARASIAKERDEALAALKGEIGRLAADLAAQILTKSDAGALGNACFDQLDAHLKGLDPSEVSQLRDDALDGGAGAVLVTAGPTSDEDRARWSGMLAGHLGNDVAIRFETDPRLIGGAELRFPHTVLKFSWADRLDRARGVLDSDDAVS